MAAGAASYAVLDNVVGGHFKKLKKLKKIKKHKQGTATIGDPPHRALQGLPIQVSWHGIMDHLSLYRRETLTEWSTPIHLIKEFNRNDRHRARFLSQLILLIDKCSERMN
jgi:hypothetical protein